MYQCSHSRRIVRDSREKLKNRANFNYHTRAFTRIFLGQEEENFHQASLLELLFLSAFHCFIVFVVLLSRKIEVTMCVLLIVSQSVYALLSTWETSGLH